MSKYMKPSAILISCILLLLLVASTSGTTEKTSAFNSQYMVLNQQLFVSIQPSLYAYYSNMTHRIDSDIGYAKLVTPHAVEPIAHKIQEITHDKPYSDEQFANAVLALVHQIPYKISGAKYPVETLINNYGDCGGLSLLAASIMKAGGLDVVLIKYTGINPGHMNIGVYLPHKPLYNSLFIGLTSFEFNNKTYWTAEATPQGDWKVGDQSYMVANADAVIIPLDKSEKTSPGQVSSNLGAQLSTSVIITEMFSESSLTKGDNRTLVISGSIQPLTSFASITLYVNKNGSYTNYFKTVTDSKGNYVLIWNFTSGGTYYITASWSGNGAIAGADSETLVIFVGPESPIQFQAGSYDYIIGRPILDVAIRPVVGVDDFLTVQLGTNISVSFNFIVLQTGHAVSDIQTENIIIPASVHTVRTGNRQIKLIEQPARTMTVPIYIPEGLEPLRLPDDFNQTINSKFCFVIQSNQFNNYSLNFKGLDEYEVSKMKRSSQINTAFLNLSQGIEENRWHKVTTRITEDGITAKLHKEDGDLVESISTVYNPLNITQLVLFIANNADSAIALKDLEVKTLDNTPPSLVNVVKTSDNVEWALQFVIIMVFLVAVFSAVAIWVKKKEIKVK